MVLGFWDIVVLIVGVLMVGGLSILVLVVVVFNVGGFGFVVGGYLSVDWFVDDIVVVCVVIIGFIGVNLFVF